MAIKEAGFFGTSAVVSEPTSRVKALPFSTNTEAETTTANLITGGFGIATQIGTMAQDYLVNKTTEEFSKNISDIAIMKSDAEIKALAAERFPDRNLTNKLPSTLRFLLAGKAKATALAQHAGNKTMKAAIVKESNDILGVNPVQAFMSQEAVAQRTTQAAAVKSVQDKYKEALKFITPVRINGTPDVAATVAEYEKMKGMIGGLGPLGKSIPNTSGASGPIRSEVIGQLKLARNVVTKTYSKNLLRLITSLGESEPGSSQRVVIAGQIRDMNRGITAGIYRNLNSEAQGGGLKYNIQPSELAFIRANIDNMMASFSGTTSWEDVKVGKELKKMVEYQNKLIEAEIINTPVLREMFRLTTAGFDDKALDFMFGKLPELKNMLIKAAKEQGAVGETATGKVLKLFATDKKIPLENPVEIFLFEQVGTTLMKSFSNATSNQQEKIVHSVASVVNNDKRSIEDQKKLMQLVDDLDIAPKLINMYNKAENKEELKNSIIAINTTARDDLNSQLKDLSQSLKGTEGSNLNNYFKFNTTTNKIEVLDSIKEDLGGNKAKRRKQADRFNTRIETLSTLNSIITKDTTKDQARQIILKEIVPIYFTEQIKETKIMKTKEKKIKARQPGGAVKKTVTWQGVVNRLRTPLSEDETGN